MYISKSWTFVFLHSAASSSKFFRVWRNIQGFSTKFTPSTPFNSKHLRYNIQYRIHCCIVMHGLYDFSHLYAVLLFMSEQQFWTAFWNVDMTFSSVSGTADFLTIWSAGLIAEKALVIEGTVFTSRTIWSEDSTAEKVFSKVFRNLQGLDTKLTPENSFNSKHLKKVIT